MAGKLEGKVAIVTGSDSGIGQSTAVELAKEGADVVVTYFHDREGAEVTQQQVEAQGRRAVVVQADVREHDAVRRIFREAEDALGIPYILVNNAGVDASGKPVAEMSDEEWDKELKTNLYGPFYCCKEFIQARSRDGGGGKIINMTSVHEEIPMQGAGAYDASKGGLRNLTRTLALELAPQHINVNNIAPGMILTPMNQRAIDDPEARREQESHIPWRRAGEPWEVAKLVVYLASDDADYVTGQTFTIDGGLTMNVGQGA